jgi:hypothetical protein
LKQPYELIQKWHSNGEIIYTFDSEGKAVYKQFADQIVDMMNDKWESTDGIGKVFNVSKDRRTMIRYIHVICMDSAILVGGKLQVLQISGVPHTIAKLAICYCILHFGY